MVAAALYDTRFPTRPGSRRGSVAPLRLVPARPEAGRRPVRATSPVAPEVYRRRRVLVAGVLLLVVAAVLILAQSVLAGTGGGPLTTTGAAASMTPASSATWVVRPGDTLWSIARAIDPHGDVRPLVDRLEATVGSDLYPGERIPLPATAAH